MKLYSFIAIALACTSCDKIIGDSSNKDYSKNYVSSLRLKELLSYSKEVNRTSSLNLLDEQKSPAACKLEKYVNALTKKMIKDLPEKFCDGSEIEINTRYSLTLGDYSYKYLFRKVDEKKYVATYCNTNGTKDVSTIETSGDGKGKVTQRYDGEGTFANGDKSKSNYKDVFQKYFDGSDDVAFKNYFFQKREDKKNDFRFNEIQFNSMGGKWIYSNNEVSKSSAANDSDLRSYFDRKVVLFDGEHGHELHNYGYPNDNDPNSQNASKHEYFTRAGVALRGDSSNKFEEGGSLFADATLLPTLVDNEADLKISDDENAWDCVGVDLSKTLVCDIESASDGSDGNDCNFSPPNL